MGKTLYINCSSQPYTVSYVFSMLSIAALESVYNYREVTTHSMLL